MGMSVGGWGMGVWWRWGEGCRLLIWPLGEGVYRPRAACLRWQGGECMGTLFRPGWLAWQCTDSVTPLGQWL